MLCAVLLVAGLWGSSVTTDTTTISISPQGGTFAGDGECEWWNGLDRYDPGICNAFTITRLPSGDVAQAAERASRCAVKGDTDCVLNGEIGFPVPSLFIYDQSAAQMRMLIAPRLLERDGDDGGDDGDAAVAKSIRLVDPTGAHPNRLFSFNTSVKIEYLVGGSRSMAVEVLTGQAAYCVQALRRSIVDACWRDLD